MSNTEWNPLPAGEYARYSVWGEDVHVHHTFEEEEEEYEEYDDEEYEGETTDEEEYSSLYEEMLADSFVHDVTLVADTMKLTLSPPIFNVTDGVPITFKHSDKATLTQQVVDGQLSLRIQENTDLQSIKICVGNRTWVIPLDTLPLLPPSMPKKR